MSALLINTEEMILCAEELAGAFLAGNLYVLMGNVGYDSCILALGSKGALPLEVLYSPLSGSLLDLMDWFAGEKC